MKPRKLSLFAILSAVLAVAGYAQTSTDLGAMTEDERLSLLESRLDVVRQALKIPGMSAAVVRDKQLIWAQGFGFADAEGEVPATEDTPYGLASVTKPVAAVLLMQLVEEGLVDLDAPVSQYGVTMDNPNITSRHLLTHSSHDTPGTSHFYDGNRYGYLAGVMEGAAGKSFAKLLSEYVLLPLDMKQTALNPIASWGGANSSDVRSFARLLGVGEAFAHYPDVYRALAHPYQLDESYEVVQGMYHLYHNPAAGLNSSVADLAKFDIALDTGMLLNDASKDEMFSPAFQTLPPRLDLTYGLGWYVQRDHGLDLYWHTGRWPPSTSALYLKVPALDLTFIVLANTDNLTVPFHGLGFGDVTTSALALTFLRYFVYPHLGVELRGIDWAAPQSELVREIESPDLIVYGTPDRQALERELLERELLSYRQAFASAGSDADARRLLSVDLAAFPDSPMRNDPLRVQTAGPRAVVPPAIPARSYIGIGWAITVWHGPVAASLVWILVALGVSRRSRWAEWLFWIAATWFFGPAAVVVYHLVPGNSRATSGWQQAIGATLYTVTGYAASWILASFLLMRISLNPHPLLILGIFFVTPLVAVMLVFRFPAWVVARGLSFGRWLSGTVFTELILLCSSFGILFFLTMLGSERVFTTLPGVSSPFFLGMMSAEAIICGALLLPLVYWMTRRGYAGWPFSKEASGEGAGSPRRAWQPLLVSIVVMVVLVAITVMQLA